MTPNDIREDIRRQPFRPVRLIVDDGSQYDIYHPDMCMIGLGSIIVGLANDPSSPYFERTVRIDCRHISRILPLPVNPAAANGPGGPVPG
jgi:hypothetical protein